MNNIRNVSYFLCSSSVYYEYNNNLVGFREPVIESINLVIFRGTFIKNYPFDMAYTIYITDKCQLSRILMTVYIEMRA